MWVGILCRLNGNERSGVRNGGRVISGSGSGLISGNLGDNRNLKSEIDLGMEPFS